MPDADMMGIKALWKSPLILLETVRHKTAK
jgi:hypothetical protein